jgi:hypothetical protein
MMRTVAGQFAEPSLRHRGRQFERPDRRHSPARQGLVGACPARGGGRLAAGADAHLSGELAGCAGNCGPGNLHLINGLFDCHHSRVPVLAIAAHIHSTEIGAGYISWR